jgi:predicted AlkP superfamily phosphohydrolase/phosphomutase/Tfp pilus assembly protein PilF
VATRRAQLIVLLVLIIGAALGWSWSAGSRRHPRVLLIGVDGADPAILDRLIDEGKLPTFARLRREGAYGRLRSREPLLSPIIWTTIATGRKAQDHGVLDFVEAAADGHTMPISSSRRRVPALWNIATQFGRTSGFIGWYASFPVERVRGFEVSDRVAFHQVRSEQATEGATFPSDLAHTLVDRFGSPEPDLSAVRRRFLSRPDAALTADGERRVAQLARMYATTEYYKEITPWLQRKFRPDLLAVYFEAIDACGHLFMEDAPPRRRGLSDLDYEAFSGTADRCYEYQDEVLADLMRAADEDTLTIICSDHGFKSGDRRPDTIGRADEGQAALWHHANGVILMHGPTVRSGATVTGATILDIAPTVLHALGVPLGRDLPGQPLRAVLQGNLARRPAQIAKYDFVPVPPGGTSADASQRLADLRALGYVTGSDHAPGATRDGRLPSSFLNEGIALSIDGEDRDALRAFATAAELDASNVNARAFAARLHLERFEFDEAKPLLDASVTLDPRSAYVRLLRANLAISTGQWDDAERELDAAAQIDSRLPMLYVQRARLLDARGHAEGALEALVTAESLTDAEPLLLDILVLRADAATELGRQPQADEAVRRAASLTTPDHLAAARAAVALTRGDAPTALGHLQAAVTSSPRSARLWMMIGATYGRAGDFDRAIDAYERSVAIEPSALACKTLAALVFEIRHDRARAVALWTESLAIDRHQRDVEQFLQQFGKSPSTR